MNRPTHAGLAPLRHVLANGATLIATRSAATPAVSFNVSLRAGVLHEPDDQPGLAHLLSQTIDCGTARRTADQIAEDLDGRGVALAVAMNRHNLTLACTCLAEDAGDLLDLIVDIVRRPVFPRERVDRRRQEIVTALGQDLDNPAIQAVQTLLGMLYGERHAYGRRPKGTIADVLRLGRDQLAAFHGRRVTPAGLTLVMAGDMEPARAIGMAGRLLEDWPGEPGPDVALPPVEAARDRRRRVVPMMNKAQADVAYGFSTIRRSDPVYYAFWIMNTVLGQYGLGGRLGDHIRERKGMAYYVYSSFDPAMIEGPLLVRAGVDAANVDRTIAAIDEEVTALARDGVSDTELADTKRFLSLSMPRLLETNAGIATFLQTAEAFGLGMDYDVRLPSLLESVTRGDVHAAAARLNPARASIAIAGPYSAGTT